ncbi:MAG: glycosyltransferase [Lachnospiraceae bacterium]|nr:glycosyltransferase [Lachnospiraceae bacterium]
MNEFIMNGPLVSVIVPVYNIGEQLLTRCLDSILKQSYNNLEVVIVDDCTPNKEDVEIVSRYSQQDGRVRVIRHEMNTGLFETRITGVEASTGEYILFVDADDFLSYDWIRTLLRKAIDTNSDMVVGEWCFAYEDGVKEYLNLDPFRIKDFELTGDEILHSFLEQRGSCFSWSLIWNKIYTRELWERCLPDFNKYAKSHGRMQMWEDFAFSFDLWMHAQKVTNVQNAYYYYYKHSGGMTSAFRNKKACFNYINDVKGAFLFAEELIEESNYSSDIYKKLLNKYKNTAVAILQRDLYRINETYYSRKIAQSFGYTVSKEQIDLFYEQRTRLDGVYDHYQQIKREIVSAETDTVSFDIFDTLLLRPFLYPTDLFDILSNKMNEDIASFVDFAMIRKNAEDGARVEEKIKSPSNEDITYEQIYHHISENCGLSIERIEKMKEEELAIEQQVLYPRQLGKELFQLAKDAGKRIIITSDMYLPKDFIEGILDKNGYRGYSKLYLSSDIMLTKATGNLFKYILKDLDIKNAKSLIHLGDNWQSDVEMPRSLGIRAEHLPKGSDIFMHYSPFYGGDAYRRIYRNSGMIQDYGMLFDSSPSTRAMIALGCNKAFDNPFVSFNPESDYNDDPRYIGYQVIGGYVLAIAQWVKEQAIEHNIPCVHFVARDGWLVKEAFDLINDTSIRSDYIRLSRKALVLCDVNVEDDIFSLGRKLSPFAATPEKIYQYLKPAVSMKEEQLWEEARALNFHKDRCFSDYTEYENFLKFIKDSAFSLELLNQYKQDLKTYFDQVFQQGDFIFDVGYSGRPEAALSNLLGYPVGSLYLHTNGDGFAENRQKKYGIKCYCFYPVKPVITGAIREHCLMERGPSTVGYKLTERGGIKPVFGEFDMPYAALLITETLQSNAIQFVSDFIEKMGKYTKYVYYNKTELAAPYEMYMHFPKEFDKHMFKAIPFEDDLNNSEEYSLLDFWNNELRRANLHNRIHEQELERDLHKVYESHSYKIGHAIVKAPGKILRKIGIIKD